MKKILHYDVGEKLGEGKNGPTYLAWDSGLERAVVIKMLDRGPARDEAWRAAYTDEIVRVNRIGSDRLANFYSLESVDGKPAIIREYVQGLSVKQLAADAAVDFEQFLKIAIEATRGLMDLQARHMIHRNITSSNIIYAKEGLVKLVDYRLDAVGTSAMSAEDLTFLAPERLTGGESSHLSDLYSLGSALYHLLTGHLPYAMVDSASLREHILSGEGLFSDVKSDRFPGDARLLVETMMAVNPGERFGGADEVLLTLREMLHFAAEKSEYMAEERGRWTSRQYLTVSLVVLFIVIIWFLVTLFNR